MLISSDRCNVRASQLFSSSISAYLVSDMTFPSSCFAKGLLFSKPLPLGRKTEYSFPWALQQMPFHEISHLRHEKCLCQSYFCGVTSRFRYWCSSQDVKDLMLSAYIKPTWDLWGGSGVRCLHALCTAIALQEHEMWLNFLMKQKFKNPFTKKLLKTLRKITFQIFRTYFPKYLGDFF